MTQSPIVARAWRRLLEQPPAAHAAAFPNPGALQERIERDRCFEEDGAFKRIIRSPGPQVIAWLDNPDTGSVMTYAAIFPQRDDFYAFTPDRIGAKSLGILGVWVHPSHRKQGHAKTVMEHLGAFLTPVPFKGLLLSAEESVVGLAQSRLPIYVLARWAYQQPNIYSLRRELSGKVAMAA